MQKTLWHVNFVLIILILLGDCLYIYSLYANNPFDIPPSQNTQLLLKGITSSLFVIMGAVNLAVAFINKSKYLRFSIALFIGLVFAMLGDIVLNLEFILGAALFAIGHICFYVAYCLLNKPHWRDFVISSLIFIFAVLFITLMPIFNFKDILMEIICIVYALIISLMVGKAIGHLFINRAKLYTIIACGSIIFFLSDFALLIDKFANDSFGLNKAFGILCLIFYYPAEILLARSIWFATKQQEKGSNVVTKSTNPFHRPI